MITFRGDKLSVTERVYKARVDRLRRMLVLDAPRCIIQIYADQVARSFAFSWEQLGWSLWLYYAPNWLKWLTSAEWRRNVAGWVDDSPEDAEHGGGDTK